MAGAVEDNFNQVVEQPLELGRFQLVRHGCCPLLVLVDEPPGLVNDVRLSIVVVDFEANSLFDAQRTAKRQMGDNIAVTWMGV